MDFIPDFLEILQNNIGVKYPKTYDLNPCSYDVDSGIDMTLSEEGKVRWSKVIKEGVEFELFRDFAQLRPYMTEEQIKQIDEILEKNRMANSLNKKTVNSSTQQDITSQPVSIIKEEGSPTKTGLSLFSNSSTIKSCSFTEDLHKEEFSPL